MDSAKGRHVDGGLINCSGASNVIVTVQAFLHCSHFIDKVVNHNNCSKSSEPATCIVCLFKNLYVTLSDKKLGDPALLISKWYDASSHLSAEEKNSPLWVMIVFIDLIRLEYADFSSRFSDIDLSPVAKIWKYIVKANVICQLCGLVEEELLECGVEFKEQSISNLQISVESKLFDTTEELCPKCEKNEATVSVQVDELPKCLIVHLERCTLQSQLPFQLEIRGTKLALKCVIVEPKGVQRGCFIITSCPDHRFRRFDDTRISMVSPQSLSTQDFYTNSSVMVIYETRITNQDGIQVSQNHRKLVKPNRGTAGMKIISYPDCSALSISENSCDVDEPDLPALSLPQTNIDLGDQKDRVKCKKTRDEGVQTESIMIDRGVQTVPYYCYETCKYNGKFKFFTGLCVEDFDTLFNLVGGHETISTLKRKYRTTTPKKMRPQKLTSEDKLLMFLMRLRRGLPLEEIAQMFQISVSLAGEMCYIMTRLLYLTFKSMEDDMFPTAVQQRKHKPLKMKAFKNLRIILDGVSIFIQSPTNFEQQGNTYSSYKAHNVVVFSIGISCNCATVFCSGGMEGSMSDKGVIVNSNLLSRLQKRDGVMTDRGYELAAELQEIGCEFFKPPTLGVRQNFTKEEEILTKAIASARIYTEHAIADIKDNRLLQGVVPMTLLPVLEDLVYIAAYLRNFGSSRIHNRRFVVIDGESESIDVPGQEEEGPLNE